MSTTFNPFSFAARQGQDENWDGGGGPGQGGNGGPNTSPNPPGPGGPNQCNCANMAYEIGHPCYEKCKGGATTPPPAPTAACPDGQCKDVVTNVCRTPGRGEKANETDDITRATGGGRGYCKKTQQWGQGGGGGGVGGTGHGTSSVTAPPVDPGTGPSDAIWQAILARLKGESRYTPGVVTGLMGEAKTLAEGQASQQEQQLNSNLAQRGMLRAPNQTEGYRQIRANVGTTLMQTNNQIQKAKIDADFEDKTAAINEGIAWLNSLRDYYARMAATNSSKEVGMANVQLGYAQLQQQLQVIREQYAQQLQLLLLGSA